MTYNQIGDDYMSFSIGDLVSRNSYNNDIKFRIVTIKNNIVILESINNLIIADCNIEDLRKED